MAQNSVPAIHCLEKGINSEAKKKKLKENKGPWCVSYKTEYNKAFQ